LIIAMCGIGGSWAHGNGNLISHSVTRGFARAGSRGAPHGATRVRSCGVAARGAHGVTRRGPYGVAAGGAHRATHGVARGT
jgi:hypothetical protein